MHRRIGVHKTQPFEIAIVSRRAEDDNLLVAK